MSVIECLSWVRQSGTQRETCPTRKQWRGTYDAICEYQCNLMSSHLHTIFKCIHYNKQLVFNVFWVPKWKTILNLCFLV